MPSRPHRALFWVLLLATGTTYYYFGLFLPRADFVLAANHLSGPYRYAGDFYPIWLTTRELLFRHRNPYTEQMTREIQTGVFGRPLDPRRPSDPPPHYRAFSYPLYADLLATPLGVLPFRTVQVAGSLLLPILTGVSVLLWLHALKLRIRPVLAATSILLTLVSYPVLEGLYAQQPVLVVGFLLAAGMAFLSDGRFTEAGVLLGLSLVKPQVVVLLALWLGLWSSSHWRTRRNLVLSFTATAAVLMLASEFLLPGWFGDWLHQLTDYRQYTQPPLVALVMGKLLGSIVSIILITCAGLACWRARREPAGSPQFSLTMSFVLGTTVLILPAGLAVYDHVVLLPAILWLCWYRPVELFKRRPTYIVALLGLADLFWQWIAACVISLMAIVTASWGMQQSTFALLLPVRTAASLPFAVLAILALVLIENLRTGSSSPETPALVASARI